MNTVKNENPTKVPLGATAILSLALALPLVTSPTVVADDYGRRLEQPSAGETRVSSLRFPAAGRSERSATVTWADLDLNRPAGLDQLYLRLAQATTTVCAPRADIRNAAMNRDRKACLETAMDNAVSRVGHLGLEEMHASRTGRSVQPGQEIAGR
ncbi:UrcA family protein [Haliea sp. E1-2-M8]|uniref:UrcA family protein n=1 Tax=Haliea sp. E1-2-M8 TaxID=3064706 RepID=UPI00272089FE|nr:UrcA family protein [Haliea sp. E1-2-M8]MDO8860675.1 UrcA family protein [Haliea sp. E1-2-M8]